MFTSLPSLFQSIERAIAQTPIVDPHTHLRADSLGAPDLASLMSYHWVLSELHAVGMPKSDFDIALPPEERVRRALPYLKRMRNTAMSWCLHRILRDLYDFHDPILDESNYRDVCDRVAQAAAQPKWAESLIRDKCRIEIAVTSLGNQSKTDPNRHADWLHFMLDAHYLFCPGVATDLEPFFIGRVAKNAYVEALAAILGDSPRGHHDLDQRLRDWLDKTVTGRVRFSNTFIPIETRFGPPDESAVDAALARALKTPLDSAAIDHLVRAVSWSVLGWHHDHAKAFQIAVGAEYFICDGKSIPRFQDTWITEMVRVFHHFGRARFDLMLASDVLLQEVVVVLRQFQNVYSSGYWWHTFFPDLIAKTAGLRLQVAPATKFSAFLCDAYYAEWTYGKLQIVTKGLAQALTRLVEMGFYDEDEIPPLLNQILNQSPRSLYDLDA
jgi:glucuronate isomerase